ncbi:glycosyltransferase family 4 protein [Phascolarctobacterium faecium]|nr:glycosyltransferase family 4 protein [Phascolarctobacterium faecium]MDM8109654.1 glycosyltransferase family 4 protein [Phascolarctobacterium faecium]
MNNGVEKTKNIADNSIDINKPKKVLFTATVVKTHINVFHLPYLKWFKEHGYEVQVAAKNDFINELCIIPNCDKYYDIQFARFPFSKTNIKAYKELKKLIQENNYDIIHCHTPVAGVLTRLAARNSKNTTVIYTVHGFHFFKGAPLLNWFMYYPVECFFARYTDKLITINKEDYEKAKQFKLRKNGKVYYVPGVGINLEKIQNLKVNVKQKKKELGIPENIPVLLSVGELIKRKNHESVLKALSKIKDKNFVYLICGRGVLKEHLQNLTKRLGLESKVKFLGFRKDIAEICKTVDLFIFPSYQEGLPVALMEAMACELPVIASNVRGNRDLIAKENLFDPEDVAALTNLIKERFEDIQNKELKKVAYANLEQYSLKNVLKQMTEIYMDK